VSAVFKAVSCTLPGVLSEQEFIANKKNRDINNVNKNLILTDSVIILNMFE
jgi:hypothetical protein